MKYWRPGLRVWWRAEGEAQLGLDPPAILFGLSKEEHVLLDALAGADPQLDVWTTASRLGWSKEKFTTFTHRLPAHALVDHPTLEATEVRRYWSMVEAGGRGYSTDRFSSSVIVDGLGALGVRLVDAMCLAGVDSVFLTDPLPVSPRDVHPGGFLADDVGQNRALAAVHRLRPRHPMARLQAGEHPGYTPRPHPEAVPAAADQGLFAPMLRAPHPASRGEQHGVDLAVVIANGAVSPARVGPYTSRDTPVLPITIREVDVVIGPLLASPGPCLRCVHLALTEADPKWPVVATQLAVEPPPGIDPVVRGLAASVASHQVVAFADGRPVAVQGMSLHVDGLHPVPRFTRWQVHPGCGCRLEHLVA